MSVTKGKPAFRAGRDTASLAENMELLTGQRGDQLDRAITRRELAAIGLAGLRKLGGGYVMEPLPPLPDGDGGEDSAVETPSRPRNVEANGAFHSVLVEWDKPAYLGHSYAEVWRAERDNLGEAVLVGTTAANLFSDAIGKAAHVWYWVRFVNRNNITGPWHDPAGVEATTSKDIQDIIDELQGQIEYSHLANWLRQDIETQSATAGYLAATVAELDKEMRERGQMILDEYVTIVGEFSTMVRQIEAIRVQADNAVALVMNEQTGRVTQDSALAQSISSVNVNMTQLGAELSARADELEYAYIDKDGAISKRFEGVESKIKTTDEELRAAISSEYEARVDEDEALADRIDLTVAELNGVSAAVQTQAQAIATINKDGSTAYQAMWGTKVQAGDIKAGIGLIAKSDGTSQVMVSASQFFVFDPNSAAPTAPLFAIDQGKVVIAEALIRKATIQIIHAEKITADYVKAGVSLSAPVINGGRINIGSNFSVDENGVVAAYGATMRYLTSYYGTFNNANINFATMRNCVIEEDCEVRGVVFADRIIGDVYAQSFVQSNYLPDGGGTRTVIRARVSQSLNFQRQMSISGIGAYLKVTAYAQSQGTSGQTVTERAKATVLLYMDGVLVASNQREVSATASSNPSQGPVRVTETTSLALSGKVKIPAKSTPLIEVKVSLDSYAGATYAEPTDVAFITYRTAEAVVLA